VGAVVEIIRSGDVIPHIQSVLIPCSSGGKMPLQKHVWTDSGVDIVLEDLDTESSVREKVIAGFFKGIGVEGLGQGNVIRIIEAGFNTIPSIIGMSKDDFLSIDGFKDKMATKLVDGIKSGLEKASLVDLMSFSNIFGRGFNTKKIELIMNEYPDILLSKEGKHVIIEKISKIKGMSAKTGEIFVEKMEEFVTFLDVSGLHEKLETASYENMDIGSGIETCIDKGHPLYGKTVVLTGTRDQKIIDFLKKVGAKMGTSVTKNTFAVITKNLDDETGKMLDAKRLGIPIYSLDNNFIV
jgi:NAD-dependent DNA ligase